MRSAIQASIQALIFGFVWAAVAASAQEPAAAELALLDGTWTVAAAEQAGKPFDAIVGGSLTIDGDSFELHTAAGNELAGKVRIDPAASPKHLDFLLSTGAVWEAIYVVSGDVFRLNYVERGDAPRPAVFATTANALGTVIVMRRGDSGE